MALKDALEKLNEEIKDLTSLHVRTYTGTLSIDPGTKVDLAKVAAEVNKEDSNLTVALETLIQFDGDAYNFVAAGATEALQTVHKDAVEAGIKTRQGLLELVTGWFD
jgi:N-methylhydantoinase B/oxoprolinase/acetone carboxylase alpha subunit